MGVGAWSWAWAWAWAWAWPDGVVRGCETGCGFMELGVGVGVGMGLGVGCMELVVCVGGWSCARA